MNMKRIQILFVLSLLLGITMNISTKAATKPAPSKYLKSVYFHQCFEGGDDDGAPLDILQKAEIGVDCEYKEAYERNNNLSIECRIYKYSGKLRYSKTINKIEDDLSVLFSFKHSKKDKCVYYCQVRVLEKGVAVSKWSKPIYCWSVRAKEFKVKMNSLKKCTIKFPKIKGIKYYKYKVQNGYKTFKKGKVKPGNTVKVNRLKLRWEEKRSEFWIFIYPVYSKKNDPLSDTNQGIQRWIKIEKR